MTKSTTTTMTPEQRVITVFQLLQNTDKNSKDEKVTQLCHALQTAQLAKNDGADEETILAALLHDIGHLCLSKEQSSATCGKNWETFHKTKDTMEFSDIDQDRVGAEYLRKLGFPKKTCDLIESHLTGKRYRLAIDPSYLSRLSSDSKQSLKLHGGPLSPTEIREFEKNPLFKERMNIMKWDEAARIPGIKFSPLDSYREMAARNLKPMI
ncbi:hypothetical protein GGI24_006936 [Coemansia furcata]|nr:hypothetical protein GGI24_006936 [Coemansia furcata]